MPTYGQGMEEELARLVQVSWVVLIPVGVLLSMVLYKLVMFLHSLSEFLTIARHELSPTLQDLRKTAGHVEVLSAKAVEGISTVEKGVHATTPMVQQGWKTLKEATLDLKSNITGLMGGLWRSFARK